MSLNCVVFVLLLIVAKISCDEFPSQFSSDFGSQFTSDFTGLYTSKFEDCPSIAVGYPPYCACRHGSPYNNETNTCPNPECPPASIAQPAYPNCICTEKNFDYGAHINECFRVCPENSSGYWPKCRCDDELATFDKRKIINFKFYGNFS